MATLELIILVTLVVLFIHTTTWEGMINEWVQKLAFNWSPYLKKPVFDCPICMAPWWGSAILVGLGLTTGQWLNWYVWILVVFAAGGLNAVLIYIISADKEVTKELKEDE